MKDIIFIATIISLFGMLVYINNMLDEVIEASATNLTKYYDTVEEFEEYIENSEMQKIYEDHITLYENQSKTNDEIIRYQSAEIKSLESKLESLTEKYVDLIN